MNCITLTEPWATLVARRAKTIETRSWPASAIGRRLAIHAAKGLTGADLDWLEATPRAWAALENGCFVSWPVFGDERPKIKDAFAGSRGRVVATCRLAACLPMPAGAYRDKRLYSPDAGEIVLSDDELRFGNFLPGRWAWALADAVALPDPIPARRARSLAMDGRRRRPMAAAPSVVDGRQFVVRVGDVVQIDPGHDDRFGGCFLVVTEVKPWGVQGYVSMPQAGKTARAYYRVRSDQMARIGRAEWVVQDDEEE